MLERICRYGSVAAFAALAQIFYDDKSDFLVAALALQLVNLPCSSSFAWC